jgi:hypothetical protein
MAPKGPSTSLPVTGTSCPVILTSYRRRTVWNARNSSHLSPGIARAHGAHQTHISRGARHDSTKGSHRR